MVMLAVDSTARPFECDIGEKPDILAGYRESSPRAMRGRPVTARGVCKMSMNAETGLRRPVGARFNTFSGHQVRSK
ncbi:hypothetical protein ACTJLB_05425 [Paraburkholderia sp. 22098]|uniref:hypothetical protein n=1 Tax=Paraburkholderia sp. 22098 TaxID=3453874 RepID=UPI003F84B855